LKQINAEKEKKPDLYSPINSLNDNNENNGDEQLTTNKTFLFKQSSMYNSNFSNNVDTSSCEAKNRKLKHIDNLDLAITSKKYLSKLF